MGRKGESITLSLSEEEREALEAIAAAHGCFWGDKPNISKLASKIANGDLTVVGTANPKLKLTVARKALETAMAAIDDAIG